MMIFTSRILEGLMARRGLVEPREGIGCWVSGFSAIRGAGIANPRILGEPFVLRTAQRGRGMKEATN
jgi:hypothetical protein